jgi:hypothetical protein
MEHASQPGKRENMNNSRRNIVGMVALLLLSMTLLAPAAFAQSSRDGYVEQGPSTLDQVGGGGGGQPPQAQASQGGELPFTGLDVGLIAIAGVSLLAMGFAMRRLTRAPDSA